MPKLLAARKKKKRPMQDKLEAAVTAAGTLFENLKADINNASTRLEHVRITALAQEAENLYGELQHLLNGLDGQGPEDGTGQEELRTNV
jgi:hypothetical protein